MTKNKNLVTKKCYAVASVLFIFLLLCKPVFSENTKMPFTIGEKLEYSLNWGGIKAGTASLEVMPAKKINGEKACRFVMHAKTTPFIDRIYKVRDTFISVANSGLAFSYYYIKKQHEGKRKKNITVTFDNKKNTAQYVCKKKAKKPISIEPGTIDPLTALYYTRIMIDNDVNSIQRYVTDGKKNILGRVKVIKKDIIEINGKNIESFLVEPDMQNIGGVFKKSKHAKLQIWLSADDRRIPLMIKSKVIVGSFTALLISDIALK
ncbi:MAG: DUF3108 domain-containing protein [Thermodesulfobacteriota bacterium]